jgi:hypothetical protein
LGGPSENPPVLIPEIRFLTNETWPLVRGVADGTGFPMLLMEKYSKGVLYVLTIPENFSDLYRIPPAAISEIKSYLMRGFPVQLDGPNRVALFAYDNNTFIVQSFLPQETDVRITLDAKFTSLRDVVTGQQTTGQVVARRMAFRRRTDEADPDRRAFSVHMMPHSYAVFAAESGGVAN